MSKGVLLFYLACFNPSSNVVCCFCVWLTEDLNLLSWSAAQNVVALSLYASVYLWNAATGSITELCEMPPGSGDDYYSSVSFMPAVSDSILALGNSLGSIQVTVMTTVNNNCCGAGMKNLFSHTQPSCSFVARCRTSIIAPNLWLPNIRSFSM